MWLGFGRATHTPHMLTRCLWSLLRRARLRPSAPRCPLLEGLRTALTPLAPTPTSARTRNMPFKKRCAGLPTPPLDSQALEPVSSERCEHTVPREGGERSSFEVRRGRGLAPVSAPPRGAGWPATCRDGTARASATSELETAITSVSWGPYKT